MEINEEKRQKFMENAGKRVNNVMHDIQILEPMARSNVYDFTKQDVEEMFTAMQETLNNAREEFYKKFEEKARSERKVFSFGAKPAANSYAGTTGNVGIAGETYGANVNTEVTAGNVGTGDIDASGDTTGTGYDDTISGTDAVDYTGNTGSADEGTDTEEIPADIF